MKINYGLLFCLIANVSHHGEESVTKNLVFNIEQNQNFYLLDYYMQKEPDIKTKLNYIKHYIYN